MSQDDLAERLDAVERRLDAAYPEPTEGSTADDQVIERIEGFAERLADLEAAVEAVEGYVGEIERIDGELEQRADAAIAAAEGAEERVDAVEQRADGLAERVDALDDRLAGTESGRGAASRNAVVGVDAAGGNGPDTADDAIAETGRSPHVAGQTDHRRCDCDAPAGSGDLGGDPPAEEPPGFQSGDGWESGAGPVRERPGRAVKPGSQASHAPATGSNGIDSRAGDTRSRRDGAAEGRPDASAESAPSAPGPLGGGRRVGPIGRADGGRPERRGAGGAAADDPTISGWDDPDSTPTDEPPDGSRRVAAECDDQSWANARTETLLDRLRSLL